MRKPPEPEPEPEPELELEPEPEPEPELGLESACWQGPDFDPWDTPEMRQMDWEARLPGKEPEYEAWDCPPDPDPDDWEWQA
jgi:hypothetical protein